MATPQVVWTKERRQAIEAIVASTTPAPDANPEIKFVLAPGTIPLIDQPTVGWREGTRLFQVFTGPLAGVQTGLQDGNFVGDMIHRGLDYFRVDIRYIYQRGDRDMLMNLNDMMSADSHTLSWRLDPMVSGGLWGNAAPLMMRFGGNDVVGSPVEGRAPTGANPPSISMILRLFYQIEFDIGERY